MQKHDLIQGSPEWLAHRMNFFNASEAPAMMGESSYKTRTDLIREIATGLTADVTPEQAALFASGHRFEALARPLAEAIVGEELYPVVGSNGKLSASFDGLDMLDITNFEHKRLNKRLRAALSIPDCTGADLPMEYQIQCEQQHMVSGAERTLFMASNWDADDNLIEELHCWYTPNPALAARIAAGWEQFEADVLAYVPAEIAAEVIAAPVESLPAVSVRMEGKIAVISNLALFGAKLKAFVEKIDRKPSTDQAFADAVLAIKTLQTAQDALEQAESAALAQTSSIEEMRRTVADFATLARTTRLQLTKIVEARKEQIKVEIVQEGREGLQTHIAALNTRLGKPYMPTISADFASVIKGKKTVASLRDAMTTELARAKIEASATADRIDANLKALRELASEHVFLFADAAQIVLKASDDLQALVKNRISEHQTEVAAKKAADDLAAQQRQDRLDADRNKRINDRITELSEFLTSYAARPSLEIGAKRMLIEANEPSEDLYGARLAEATALRTRVLAALADQHTAMVETERLRAAASPPPVAAPVPPPAPVSYGYRTVTRAPAQVEQFTVRLGEVQALIAPYTITAEGLAQQGFQAHVERGLKLYRRSDVTAICIAASKHFAAKAEQQLEAA